MLGLNDLDQLITPVVLSEQSNCAVKSTNAHTISKLCVMCT